MKVKSKLVPTLMCLAFLLSGFSSFAVKAEEVEDKGLPINEENFPDDNFRACVAVNSDQDDNGFLDSDEIFETWNLYCENSGVESIEGIEHFRYLKGLWCKGNNITEMDLSRNPDLEGVWCSYNPITELNFSKNPKLAWVYCFNCNLTSLDFSNNPKLAYLECNANPNLSKLDVSKNRELENLFCSECSLTELDVTNNPLLCELTCFKNDLKTLDISNNPLLKRLDVWHNPKLKDLNVSHLRDLQYYNIAKTSAKNVNIKNNPHLLEFVCGYNDGIRTLDLSQNPDLTYLTVECDTQLQSLDISHNPKLYYLMAFGLSSIENIDISKNYRLCKAYNEGTYVHETEKLVFVYSKTLDYGGSSDPFDELRHCIALDDRITGSKVNAKFNGKKVPDCKLDTIDGLSDSDSFITRGQAIQTLYELAGKPSVTTKTRFTDVPKDASYYDAVRWGEAKKICFGYPVICDNTFNGEELINRQDFALMAHRFADLFKLGTSLDYGRSDWYKDSLNIDFYAWAPFTWALQWKIVHIEDNSTHCYPHGRISYDEFKNGLENLFDIDPGASYAQRVGGNFGADGDPDATEKQGTGYFGNIQHNHVNIVIPTTYPGTKSNGGKTDADSKKDSKTAATKKKTTAKKVKAPARTTLSSVKNTKKLKLTAKWKKVKDADGYQIEYSLNKKFTKSRKSKTIKGNTKKSLSFTSKGLKKTKIYYVRVRAYKTNAKGKKVYGKWSAVKKLKIRK